MINVFPLRPRHRIYLQSDLMFLVDDKGTDKNVFCINRDDLCKICTRKSQFPLKPGNQLESI